MLAREHSKEVTRSFSHPDSALSLGPPPPHPSHGLEANSWWHLRAGSGCSGHCWSNALVKSMAARADPRKGQRISHALAKRHKRRSVPARDKAHWRVSVRGQKAEATTRHKVHSTLIRRRSSTSTAPTGRGSSFRNRAHSKSPSKSLENSQSQTSAQALPAEERPEARPQSNPTAQQQPHRTSSRRAPLGRKGEQDPTPPSSAHGSPEETRQVCEWPDRS